MDCTPVAWLFTTTTKRDGTTTSTIYILSFEIQSLNENYQYISGGKDGMNQGTSIYLRHRYWGGGEKPMKNWDLGLTVI